MIMKIPVEEEGRERRRRRKERKEEEKKKRRMVNGSPSPTLLCHCSFNIYYNKVLTSSSFFKIQNTKYKYPSIPFLFRCINTILRYIYIESILLIHLLIIP
jgi:hypothetical protein